MSYRLNRSSLTVVLTVRLLTHTMKSVTFYNTLETFTFGSTYYINFFTFGENVDSNGFTQCFFEGIIAEFFYEFLWRQYLLLQSDFFLRRWCAFHSCHRMPSG